MITLFSRYHVATSVLFCLSGGVLPPALPRHGHRFAARARRPDPPGRSPTPFSYLRLFRSLPPGRTPRPRRTRDGELAFLAWQVAGGRASEPLPGWRLFIVAEIGNLALAVKTFPAPRPDYRAERSGLAEIELEIIDDPRS